MSASACAGSIITCARMDSSDPSALLSVTTAVWSSGVSTLAIEARRAANTLPEALLRARSSVNFTSAEVNGLPSSQLSLTSAKV